MYDRIINDLILVDIKNIIEYYKTCKNNYNGLDDFIETHHIKKEYKSIIKNYMEVLK